jgi:hypothetical protein
MPEFMPPDSFCQLTLCNNSFAREEDSEFNERS